MPDFLEIGPPDDDGVEQWTAGTWLGTRWTCVPRAGDAADGESASAFEARVSPFDEVGTAGWRGPEPLLEVVRAYGRFLLDAGPLCRILRMDDLDGVFLPDAFGYYSFWPLTDGTVRVDTWPRVHGSPPAPPAYLPAELPTLFPSSSDLFSSLLGPLYERILDASPTVLDVLTVLYGDAEDHGTDVTLPYLLDLAEAVAT